MGGLEERGGLPIVCDLTVGGAGTGVPGSYLTPGSPGLNERLTLLLECPVVVASDSYILTREMTTVNVSGTSYASLYAPTIPGGTLGTNGMLRLIAVGEWRNGSASLGRPFLRVRLGATTVLEHEAAAGTLNITGAARRGFRVTVLVMAQAATSQYTIAAAEFGDGAPTTGLSSITTVGTTPPRAVARLGSAGLTSVNMAVDQVLSVDFQFTVAHVNLYVQKFWSFVEVL